MQGTVKIVSKLIRCFRWLVWRLSFWPHCHRRFSRRCSCSSSEQWVGAAGSPTRRPTRTRSCTRCPIRCGGRCFSTWTTLSWAFSRPSSSSRRATSGVRSSASASRLSSDRPHPVLSGTCTRCTAIRPPTFGPVIDTMPSIHSASLRCVTIVVNGRDLLTVYSISI